MTEFRSKGPHRAPARQKKTPLARTVPRTKETDPEPWGEGDDLR